MPGPIAHAVRSYLALLRGPVATNVHAFANQDITRAGFAHKGLLTAWPEPASPGGADFGIQEMGGFSVDLADLADADRTVTRRADLFATFKTSIVPEIGQAPLSYSRNLAARFRDWEGRARLVPANCSRHRGARIVRNRVSFSDDITNAAHTKVNCTPSLPGGLLDGSQPTRLTLTGGNAIHYFSQAVTADASVSTVWRGVTVDVSGLTSKVVALEFGAAGGGLATATFTWTGPQAITIGGGGSTGRVTGVKIIGDYKAVLYSRSDVPAAEARNILLYIGAYGAYSGNGEYIDVTRAFNVDVTGASDSARPPERLSTGVLAFPFHGAGVDGVKYFDYPNQNAVSGAGIVTEGAAPVNKRVAWARAVPKTGNKITTPNSAALANTGDKDICYYISTHQASVLFYGSYVGAANGFAIRHGPAANITLFDGAANLTSGASPASVGLGIGVGGWFRIRHDVDNGAAGRTTKFYYHIGPPTLDPAAIAWTQLGGDRVTAGAVNIVSGTAGRRVNGYNSTDVEMSDFRLFRLVEFNGFIDAGGVKTLDFNPLDASAGAAAWVSSATGETWTVATSGAGNLMRTEEAFTDATMDRLYGEPAATYRQCNPDFNTGYTTGGTTSRAVGALTPNGDLTGYTLGDTDAGQQSFFRVQWAIANDAAGRLFGVFINKDAVTNRFPAVRALISGGAGINHTDWLNTATGQSQADAGNTGGQSWVYELADHWLVMVWIANNTSGNTVAQLYVYPAAGTVIGTGSIAAQGTVGACWPFMVEGLTNADPVEWIDASAGDVARPKDAMTFDKATLISDVAGTVAAKAKAQTWVDYRRIIGDSGPGGVTPLCTLSTNSGAGIYDGTTLGYGAAGVPASGARLSLWSRWGAATMQAGAGTVGGAEVAYAGTMLLTNVGIFTGSGFDFHGCIGDLEIYKGIKWQAEHIPQLGAGQVTVSHVDAIAAGVPFSETPWGIHQSIGSALINQQCDLELVTQYTHEDGTTSESVHARRAVCKGWKKRKNVTTLTFADLDMAALAAANPSRTYDVAAFAELFDGHVGRTVSDGRGVVVKMPLTELVKTGGTWKYGSAFYDAAVAVTVLAVYRDGRVVDPAEYATGTLAAAVGGYTARTIHFTREQIDPQGRRYEMQADLQIVGTTVRASDEVKRLLTLAGETPNAASFTAAEAYGTTHKMWCDAAYVKGRSFRDAINDLLLICRADLIQNAAREWVLVQDQVGASAGTYVEAADLIEVEEYGTPDIPRNIRVEYRPIEADEEKFNTPPRTRTTGGSGADKIYKNPYIRQHETADRLCDYLAKRAAQPRARVRVYGVNCVKGEVITIVGNTAWQGAKDFVVDSITYGADSNLLELREYSAAVHTYTPATLPADPTNGYSPDYSQTPPAAPTSLAVISQGATVEADGKITSHALIRAVPPAVNWAKLIIYVTDTGNNGVYQAELKLNAGNYEATVPGLRPNQGHSVIAQAVNATNVNGVATAPVGFTSANHTGVPATVGGLSVTQDAATCLRVFWNHTTLANRAGYILERSDNGGATWPNVFRLGRDTNTFLDNGVSTGFTFYYRVRQADTSGNESANSTPVSNNVSPWASSTQIIAAGILNASMSNNSIDRNQVVNSAISGAKTDVFSSVNNFFGVTNGTVIQLTSNQGLWSTVDNANFICVGGGGPSNTRWRNDGGTTNVTAYENYWA